MSKKWINNGFFTFLFVFAMSSKAFAADDLNRVAENIVQSSDILPALISSFAYLGGLVLAVSAIFKTIDHVSNPAQTPMRTPVARFLVGGALFALPIVLEAVTRTIGWGGTFDPDPGAAFTATGIFGTMSAVLSGTANFNGMLFWIYEGMNELPGLVSAVGYLLGVLMVVSGLFHVRDHIEDPDRVKLGQPLSRLLVAGALFALPTVFEAMYETIADGGLGTVAYISMLIDLTYWYNSYDTAGIDCTPVLTFGTTLGAALCNTMNATVGIPAFMNGLAYLLGMIFGVWGLIKIRDHVNSPSQTPLHEGIMRLLAGGAFFALPVITSVIQTTLTGPLLGGAYVLFGGNTGYSADGSLSCTTSNSLDEMLSCFMKDVVGPMHVLLNYFCYVAGLIFIMIGVSRLVRSSQEGAKGPGGLGTVSTFVIGGLLCSSTVILRTLSSSFFGDMQTSTSASIAFSASMSTAELQATYNIINAVLRFMLIIGMISFVRGLFIIRDVAEGSQQASVMAAMTHIVGGALAVNLGPLLNAVQDSLGIDTTLYGITFS